MTRDEGHGIPPQWRGIVVIRNGVKLCDKCRRKGCERHLDRSHDHELAYQGDEPCECCELEIEMVSDEFGI